MPCGDHLAAECLRVVTAISVPGGLGSVCECKGMFKPRVNPVRDKFLDQILLFFRNS